MGLYERTALLIGKTGIEKLKNARVTVIGIGGVGGYVGEMLVRAGVGHLTLVDGDKVEVSNKNRQITATDLTVGKYKAEVARDRFITINGDCKFLVVNEYFSSSNFDKILVGDENFVVDAIDRVQDKVMLITETQKLGIPIVSAMGAGKQLSSRFEIADIYKTAYDPLSKKMRGLLKTAGVKKLDVCYSKLPVLETGSTIGSISYAPAMAGAVIAEYVIQRLLI